MPAERFVAGDAQDAFALIAETLPSGIPDIRTKVRITKSEISMRTWHPPMSAASQGALVVIPPISHSDIAYVI